ncbi:hypothetical protein [Streptomyces cirratus]|uniref:hypothetical protein n=1 Tax=Streptomyces cirratus TaxID=68187 RepID=UPI0036060212
MPALRADWRDPLLRSVCALLMLAGAVFTFAAPPTIAAVNRWTGVPNFSAPWSTASSPRSAPPAWC